jgi:hypothetical protein
MGFFLKQGRHRNNQENRLLDSRNALGETPLLRASTVGKIPSLKVRSAIIIFHTLRIWSCVKLMTDKP